MGAAEWTGCYASGSANTTTPSAYSPYYHHHPHPNHHHHHHHHQHHHAQMAALPPPPPPPAAIASNSNSAVALTHAYGGMTGYDASAAALAAEHASFHLPAVLPDMQTFCPNSEYHAAAGTTIVPPHCSPTYGSNKTDIDPLNAGYASYNNWSNGYNNYQQPQYPPTPTTMVLCPQLYSVNQNQIHLHVHGHSDKIEQYLGASENALTISSLGNNRSSIEIGIGTSDLDQSATNIMHGNNHDVNDISVTGDVGTVAVDHQQQQQHTHQHQHHISEQQQQHNGLNSAQQHQHQQQHMDAAQHVETSVGNISGAELVQHTQTRDEDVVGDMGSVWRPY